MASNTIFDLVKQLVWTSPATIFDALTQFTLQPLSIKNTISSTISVPDGYTVITHNPNVTTNITLSGSSTLLVI